MFEPDFALMLLHWIIPYFDFEHKTQKDRELFLDTNTLDAVTKAAVEATYELGSSGTSHVGLLKYRGLFSEQSWTTAELERRGASGYGSIYVSHDYLEDENGQPTTHTRAARALFGDSSLVVVPSSLSRTDIAYITSDQNPIQIDKITLSNADCEALGYFVRDLRALEKTAFVKEGPGRLMSMNTASPRIETAVTEVEIAEFVTIFRRLFMHKEPHNFRKTVKLFAARVGDYPVVRWVEGVCEDYAKRLGSAPNAIPFTGSHKWTFSRKDLLDVFIGSRYAHQPDEHIKRRYEKYIQESALPASSFAYLFLTEIHQLAGSIRSAGRVIAGVFEQYCNFHGNKPAILDSLVVENPGIGASETKEAKRRRIFEEKATEIARQLWRDRGRPKSGFEQFLNEARESLDREL